MKMKYNAIVIGLITVIVLIVGYFFAYPYLYNLIYNQGVNDAIISLAVEQTDTGNILLVNNGTIQQYAISTICGA